jgi:hypothetical protein
MLVLLLVALFLQPVRAERPTAFWNVSVVDTTAGLDRHDLDALLDAAAREARGPKAR